MKKIIFIISLLFIFPTSSFADNIITFGKSTYEQADDSIIFGSLGDEANVSQYEKLGNNDYIPENAYKNLLKYEGYTQAWDYSPTYDGYYPEAYNQKPPSDLELHELQFSGLGANPREIQSAYVLEKEWQKFSAESQDKRINTNTNRIEEVNTIQSNWNNAQDVNINRVENESIDRDNDLSNDISNVDSKQTARNDNQDKNIQSNTNKINDLDNRVSKLEETQNIVGAEIRIHDSKKWQVNIFADYSTTRSMVDRTGIRFTYKFGESYEEKLIKELERKIDSLQ